MAGTLEDISIWEDGEESLGEEVLRMPTDEIVSRTRLMDNEIKIMKSELMRITHELQTQNEKIRENAEKVKANKTLPYLVSNVIELLDVGKCTIKLFFHWLNYVTILKICFTQNKRKKMMAQFWFWTINGKANALLLKHPLVKHTFYQ